MATAIASSKLLPAEVNAKVVVRGSPVQRGAEQVSAGPHDREVGQQRQRDAHHVSGREVI